MALLSDLLDRVHDEYPAVPEAMALRALSDATKEFCSRTHAWQASIPRVNLRDGRRFYELYPDEGVQIVALKEVRFDGTVVTPLSAELGNISIRSPSPGAPRYYTQISPTTLELVREPDVEGTLTVKAALTLARNATEVELPDTLLDEYGIQIAAGAKLYLARQVGQPWSSPENAVGHGGVFYTSITDAKRRVFASLGDAQMQVQMRTWE